MLLAGLVCAGCKSSHKSQSAAGGKPEKHLALNPAPPQRLAVTATTRGPNDPHDFDLSLLIPAGSRLRQLWFVHRGHARDQVLVEWVRSRTVSLYGSEFSVSWG
jgi:hypothetical protein